MEDTLCDGSDQGVVPPTPPSSGSTKLSHEIVTNHLGVTKSRVSYHTNRDYRSSDFWSNRERQSTDSSSIYRSNSFIKSKRFLFGACYHRFLNATGQLPPIFFRLIG
ncbi:hypothetical protein L1987_23162 [Smallanthus sonchifolius]|uniref:Uncharacterized protein n=1 Tax=Smallanthus sonchifolius TaxID=185202 RepID=A0ACB9IJI3_9ASTR|nr:hypothetical protein L1987_23162 [Smallanthus sonchifolius]